MCRMYPIYFAHKCVYALLLPFLLLAAYFVLIDIFMAYKFNLIARGIGIVL